MLTANSLFDVELRKRITETVDRLKDQLAEGLMDHDRYMSITGEIRGLNLVHSLCEEVNTKLQER